MCACAGWVAGGVGSRTAALTWAFWVGVWHPRVERPIRKIVMITNVVSRYKYAHVIKKKTQFHSKVEANGPSLSQICRQLSRADHTGTFHYSSPPFSPPTLSRPPRFPRRSDGPRRETTNSASRMPGPFRCIEIMVLSCRGTWPLTEEVGPSRVFRVSRVESSRKCGADRTGMA